MTDNNPFFDFLKNNDPFFESLKNYVDVDKELLKNFANKLKELKEEDRKKFLADVDKKYKECMQFWDLNTKK